ncbi:MAG: hypothetical protein ACKOCT_13705, partial [Alphaproteobacteria bacterium]
GRIGATGLESGYVARLWAAAAVAAAAGWAVKLAVGIEHPAVVGALAVGAYGAVYLGLAVALGLPEARRFLARLPVFGPRLVG